jgi:hypothetical protein
MFVSDGAGDFLDAHIGMHEEVGCLQQSLFSEQLPQTKSSALLKEVLKAGSAYRPCEGGCPLPPG